MGDQMNNCYGSISTINKKFKCISSGKGNKNIGGVIATEKILYSNKTPVK
jgi:hypothetical protein